MIWFYTINYQNLKISLFSIAFPLIWPITLSLGQQCIINTIHRPESMIKPDQLLNYLSEQIELLHSENQQIYQNVTNRSELRNLFRYVENPQQHINKIQDYVISQKIIISEEITNLANYFG